MGMSDEKPFATVAEEPNGWRIHLAGQPIGLPWANSVTPREVAESINAAVAQREAKLLGEVVALIRRHETHGPIFTAVENLCADVFKLHPDGEYVDPREAISYAVLAGQLQAKLEGAWAVLSDLANSGEDLIGDTAVGLMRVLGLPSPHEMRSLKKVSDDGLRAECRRRGMVIEQRYDPPLRVPASLPDLQSELRPGQVFGGNEPTAVIFDEGAPNGERCRACGRLLSMSGCRPPNPAAEGIFQAGICTALPNGSGLILTK
jgi:hypothetical protein